MYSTTKNKLEVQLDSVEAEEEVLQRRRRVKRNCCAMMWGQLRRRTAFLATPPPIWIFLILLGFATAFCVYVLHCRCSLTALLDTRSLQIVYLIMFFFIKLQLSISTV